METQYTAALIAFLGGAVISLINAVITAKQVKSNKDAMGNASVLRQILGLIYLAATYFVVRKLGIDYFLPLLGAAIGVTIPAILFAKKKEKNMKGDD